MSFKLNLDSVKLIIKSCREKLFWYFLLDHIDWISTLRERIIKNFANLLNLLECLIKRESYNLLNNCTHTTYLPGISTLLVCNCFLLSLLEVRIKKNKIIVYFQNVITEATTKNIGFKIYWAIVYFFILINTLELIEHSLEILEYKFISIFWILLFH